MTGRTTLAALVVCTALLVVSSVASASPREQLCREHGASPRVYLLGSSTMGSVLGPMLQGQLKRKWSITARRWGKASSGLARPDYHNWPSKVPRLMKRHRPHYTVVSLGTNDMQPLRVGRKWVKTKNPKWAEIYRDRVRKMLNLLTGEDRSRGVIWLGPTAFESRNSRVMGPIINDIIRTEIEAFNGPAVFVDARAATTDSQGKPIVTFTVEGKKKRLAARAKDGIHLTTNAVKWLMAKPVMDLLAGCVDRAVQRQADEPPQEVNAAPLPPKGAEAAQTKPSLTSSSGTPDASNQLAKQPSQAEADSAASSAKPHADEATNEGITESGTSPKTTETAKSTDTESETP